MQNGQKQQLLHISDEDREAKFSEKKISDKCEFLGRISRNLHLWQQRLQCLLLRISWWQLSLSIIMTSHHDTMMHNGLITSPIILGPKLTSESVRASSRPTQLCCVAVPRRGLASTLIRHYSTENRKWVKTRDIVATKKPWNTKILSTSKKEVVVEDYQ